MINQIMAGQYGLISRAQALEAGLTKRQIQLRVRRRDWRIADRGIYQTTTAAESWESRLLGACLATGGVASHRCAAALWRLDGWRSPPVEITVPRGSSGRTLPHRVHQTTQWDRIDPVDLRGMPATGIERTILDLAAKVSVRRVEMAVESAFRLGLTTWPALRSCLIRHSRRGRDGCGRLRAFLEHRYGDDELPLSEWSRLVANLLQDAGLPAPVLEHPVHGRDGQLITVLDLAWPSRRVGLELDSVRWHLSREAFERDKRKRNKARLLGWTIHEATWSMTVGDHFALVGLIRDALDAAEAPFSGRSTA